MDRAVVRAHVREVLAAKFGMPGPAAASPAPAAAPKAAPASPPVASPVPAARPGRDLVVEEDVHRARAKGGDLVVRPGTIITPLARETAARFRVRIVEASAAAPPPVATKAAASASAPSPAPTTSPAAAPAVFGTLALASDHGGFPLKTKLKEYVEKNLGLRVVDLGTHSEAAVDYPDFAHAAAGAVVRGEVDAAIVVDGAGIGSAMAANRRRGVRAATCLNILQAMNAREHNDANVLCLGGRHLGEDAAKAVVTAFVRTAFAGGRHQARVDKIDAGAV
jgi:ribose 5-phosphate isomerase B